MNYLSLPQQIMIWILPILFAVTVHETAHGWVASLLGDNTAKRLGRLTLNPLKHIDLLGTIILPIVCVMFGGVIFGWAKPVPINPFNFKHFRRDSALVAVAGPLSNLLMALIWGGIGRLGAMLTPIIGPNAHFLIYSGLAGIMINIVLMILNLLPIPPLDGSRVVSALLPPNLAKTYDAIEPYGFFILIILLFSGILSFVLGPILDTVQSALFTFFGL